MNNDHPNQKPQDELKDLKKNADFRNNVNPKDIHSNGGVNKKVDVDSIAKNEEVNGKPTVSYNDSRDNDGVLPGNPNRTDISSGEKNDTGNPGTNDTVFNKVGGRERSEDESPDDIKNRGDWADKSTPAVDNITGNQTDNKE